LGVDRGDEVVVNEEHARVSGLTGGTNLIATQFAFFDLASVEQASGYLPGQSSFVVIDVAEDADAEAVRLRIEEQFPDVSAHHVDTFLENNLYEAMAGFEPFSRLVTGVGLIAAAALVAMLIQGIVEERKRELAVLLAMGASLGSLVGDLLKVALLTASAGVVMGSLLANAMASATEAWIPTLTLQMRWADPFVAWIAFSIVALLGACLPLTRLRNIDAAPIRCFVA
jgi:predicted lysophospholipase L1 biosynthesis ABC-type transport system permease subunit